MIARDCCNIAAKQRIMDHDSTTTDAAQMLKELHADNETLITALGSDTKKAGEAYCCTRLFERQNRAYSESVLRFVAEYLPRRSISMSKDKRSP